MVKNETNCLFLFKDFFFMDVRDACEYTLCKDDKGYIFSCVVSARTAGKASVLLEGGFYVALVESGHVRLSGANSTVCEACKKDMFVLTPSMRCEICSYSDDFAMRCIYVNPDYFDSLFDGLPMYYHLLGNVGVSDIPIFHLDANRYRYMKLEVRLFSEHLKTYRYFRDGIIRHLCGFLLLSITDMLCCGGRSRSLYVKRADEIFRSFKKLLADNYRLHHDLSFYADKLNISTTYLSRIVKNTTGRTVKFHISELICTEAKRLLESSDMSVNEISEFLGFSDQSVFGKFFALKYGVSPMKYRTKKT